MAVAEDPLGGGWVEPTGSGRQHHGDLVRGGFQTVQGSVAPGSERGTASLTAKGLDALGMATFAIPNQGVEVSIGDTGVRTLRVRTSVALGIHSLRCSSATFHLTPGAYWRRDRSHA